MHFTYFTHGINKYFRPGSLHQFHKSLENLHPSIKRAANITLILCSISRIFMSFSLLYAVTNTSIFANIKLFPCLSNLLCGSSSGFHWCFGFDDRRDVNPRTLNSHNDIQELSIQSSISHLIFSLVCRSKHFSSHQFGHTYFTLTLFFPIIDAFVMN